MKKRLNGYELAEFIKERQAKAVRGLRQEWKIIPKLALLFEEAARNQEYINQIAAYAEDILIDIEAFVVDSPKALEERLELLNNDDTVQAIALGEVDATVANKISDKKDVTAQKNDKLYQQPDITAVDWLLASVNLSLETSSIAVIGNNRLARGLEQQWKKPGFDVELLDCKADDIFGEEKDIIVDTRNNPTDGATASFFDDATVLQTQQDGEVGFQSLAIVALFENVITATRAEATKSED